MKKGVIALILALLIVAIIAAAWYFHKPKVSEDAYGDCMRDPDDLSTCLDREVELEKCNKLPASEFRECADRAVYNGLDEVEVTVKTGPLPG